jgi:hypothetical protein
MPEGIFTLLLAWVGISAPKAHALLTGNGPLITFSSPAKAPPQMNRMLVVSIWISS